MRVKVLKTLPQGQEPGEIIDVHEDIARAFALVGAVEPVVDQAVEPAQTSADATAASGRARRSYQRRDVVAED